MAGIDSILERLVTDPSFRKLLRDDPASALDGYELNQDDLDLLAAQLDDSGGASHGVEQRTSKSALFGLLGAATGDATGDATAGAGQQQTDWDFVSRSRRWMRPAFSSSVVMQLIKVPAISPATSQPANQHNGTSNSAR